MKCQCCGHEMALFKNYKKTYVCQACKHTYWNWQKSDQEIKEYYDSWRIKEKPIAKEDRIKWSKNICEFVKSSSIDLNNKKVLEIGAFDGTMSRTLLENFKDSEVHLNEIDTNSCKKYLFSEFKNVYNVNFKNLEGEFDCLVAIDVLEHFDNLQEFVDKVNELKFEYLVFQVPYQRPRHLKTDKLDFHPHYHMFSKDSIIKLFKKDFILSNWRSTPHQYSAKGPEQICVFKRRKNVIV